MSEQKRSSFGLSAILAATLLISGSVKAAPELHFDERVFDFGHVGIGFTVKHDFIIYNTSDKPHKIDSFFVGCDCSEAYLRDSVLGPGDTARFELEFETTKFYGPTNKSLKVYTDYGGLGQQIFYYQAIVGQWMKLFYPEPSSFFFLPGHPAKKLIFTNGFDVPVELVELIPYDSSFSYEVLTDRADKGEKIELSIAPSESASSGTFESCLTMQFKIEGIEKPFRVTVPVKTVKY